MSCPDNHFDGINKTWKPYRRPDKNKNDERCHGRMSQTNISTCSSVGLERVRIYQWVGGSYTTFLTRECSAKEVVNASTGQSLVAYPPRSSFVWFHTKPLHEDTAFLFVPSDFHRAAEPLSTTIHSVFAANRRLSSISAMPLPKITLCATVPTTVVVVLSPLGHARAATIVDLANQSNSAVDADSWA